MKITDIKSQPCDVKNITLRVRGDNRERTAQFTVSFDFSDNILEVLTIDKQKWQLKGLWDEDQKPKPGIEYIRFSREHSHYLIDLQRNNAPVMKFHADKIDQWKIVPKSGGVFGCSFRAFGVCSEGDAESLHKLLKDPGITLTLEGTAQSSELFD